MIDSLPCHYLMWLRMLSGYEISILSEDHTSMESTSSACQVPSCCFASVPLVVRRGCPVAFGIRNLALSATSYTLAPEVQVHTDI